MRKKGNMTRVVSRTVVSLLAVVLILVLVPVLLVHTAVALSNTIKCQSLSGVEDETGTKLIEGDFIQIICTGANGNIDTPPDSNGDPTDDDWLVDTTYAGCGFPFEPNTGKFDKSIDTSNLNIGDIIYCRAWNDGMIADATYYGDSGTYTVTGAETEIHDFGTWSTDTFFQADTTPPASITNLQNTTYAATYINWTWDNPSDSDFNHTVIYIDSAFKKNTSNNYYNATGFSPATAHKLSTHTVDTSGNINTTWVNHTATTAPTHDTNPPAAVTDLATSNPTSNSITLTWTAPGDDGNTETASLYDIRYALSQITDANWNTATQVTGEPSPQPAGSTETFTVPGLSASTTYYFAIKTADEVPNWSPISNSPSGTTKASGPTPTPSPSPTPPTPTGVPEFSPLGIKFLIGCLAIVIVIALRKRKK